MIKELIVVGGGLAGSEAAWQAAEAGIEVRLYEMRPDQTTPAHETAWLAELVCSNSLGSDLPHKAPGLLKAELRGLGSLILECATSTAVPAGSSLAVDREGFARLVTERIAAHPRIALMAEEMPAIPDRPTIIASGPLTSPSLTQSIGALTTRDHLYFYDAVSPIVQAETIDMSIAFRQSRYDKGEQEEGDYINCPMNREEYEAFVEALLSAETITLKQFEREDPHFFEGCMPIEALAARGRDALAFGPMRPVGLIDPRTGRRPHAVVQLRQDNLIGSLFNIVGFQTNLKWGDQKRVLRLIPGLAGAEFARFGMMHRNTYINAPAMLQPTMQYRNRADLFFAGQIVGVEGYVGNAGTGLLAGINAARLLQGAHPVILPPATMLGALCHYVTHSAVKDFQPMKANFGILPSLPPRPGKEERGRYYAERALTTLRRFAREHGLRYDPAVAAMSPASPARE
ncbi:MAG: methylenetetrahydrofolate--tRNA-(uracil(54)-C(5))-methyltransferase (FADH(2)-oxidizing) TrmFO [Candidatus Promineofilum sp.]|uniref:methylenetetrahydrofolate--tRNA-(uracil(54)- C(5))-methyltransferase (FADH(2)-oxidizing) TrmFO n=1 Tax=Promineifilum sp. TaxID=2664178 RepID=UPI002411A9D7|nr:methylenetetrahydrofolate--tRNA-(uracil(54)-C(5))-methyltransferase (FADH(2)-oxidizing) TrmFO [Promineifilum sp.]MCO5179574.1 methylenetetrahydrofolate--tRNA-(uracil(54)-C(5))-methyltransferase (FADH(2)-oxidizing) TrmFO [Promineifilum sp.]